MTADAVSFKFLDGERPELYAVRIAQAFAHADTYPGGASSDLATRPRKRPFVPFIFDLIESPPECAVINVF
jgi:hypothetical protein